MLFAIWGLGLKRLAAFAFAIVGYCPEMSGKVARLLQDEKPRGERSLPDQGLALPARYVAEVSFTLPALHTLRFNVVI